MKSIEEKINYYKESLDLFDDGMEKYKFLIDQAKNAKMFLKSIEMTLLKYLVVRLKFGWFLNK